jgi:hypothetical protein
VILCEAMSDILLRLSDTVDKKITRWRHAERPRFHQRAEASHVRTIYESEFPLTLAEMNGPVTGMNRQQIPAAV